jgi:hypothetical protein
LAEEFRAERKLQGEAEALGLSPGQLLGRPIRIRAHLDGAIFGDTTTAGEAYAPDSVNQAMPFVEQQSGGAKMEAAVEAGGEER